MKEFWLSLRCAATILAIVAIGMLGGNLVEGVYGLMCPSLGLPVPTAAVRGIITTVTTLVVVVGSGMAYMERR